MNHIIVGTAGHIDHGKTALVRALTGIDTDRLKEEKTRGISIDLGFAHLDLADGLRASFVDVPGHERFIKNMLAGATGIDLVLFVVAADEGIKPQTREHFDICRLLSIPRGIVVVTKTDLADPELQEIVRLEIDDFTAGSFLEGAPVHAVSSTTGQGIPQLKAEILAMAASIRVKDASRHFRMPIDRSFTMRGFGPVVTGTVIAGAAAVGDELELHPSGKPVRIRGIQAHGEHSLTASAGQRAAINLSGIAAHELARGMTIMPPGLFESTVEFGCRLQILPSSPAFRQRYPVHLHVGTAQLEAEVRLLDCNEAAPGSAPLAKIRLAEPEGALILPGDRFILRRFSPLATIAGGVVIDPFPPRGNRSKVAAWLASIERAGAASRVAMIAGAEPGITKSELIARGAFTEAEIAASAVRSIGDSVVTLAGLARLKKEVATAVAAYHSANPLAPGIPKEELRGRLPDRTARLLESILAEAKDLRTEGEFVRTTEHRLRLDSHEDAALSKIEDAFRAAGLAVPATDDVLRGTGLDAGRARAVFQILLRNGTLLRVSSDLVFHQAALLELRSVLAARAGQKFSVSEFKTWTGVSRKYAIPLLEYCDRLRLTRREGEHRIILGG